MPADDQCRFVGSKFGRGNRRLDRPTLHHMNTLFVSLSHCLAVSLLTVSKRLKLTRSAELKGERGGSFVVSTLRNLA
jgi:hypothetical protein